uniref:NADH-ubiquinone oxidoreductase chain 6 n=1 Tax=Neopanorpa pulchra TaxID=557178 RepID=C7SFN9_9NEOP|nr:NADH dehydrogenase subunit 6 [Neopanorpa pulchra]ACH87055.1 NADH dehydrogenase subunit 6 [Neopanorpa pulchra]AFU51398.1 NADH dehydrogenase subunit 6 [Neopanorpa pulchra]
MFQFLLLMLSMIISFIFTQMKHPLAMGLILLIQTLIICLTMGLITKTFWFSYILFLVFLGGMLVLFIYMTSLASNEMFSLSFKLIFSFLMFFLMIMFISLLLDKNLILSTFFNFDMNNFMESFMLKTNENSLNLTKLYNQPTSMITLMLINYLLLTLIVIVKITNIFYGPLRQKN